MGIKGIGIDLAKIQRFERTLAKFGPRFLKKVLHTSEIQKFEALSPDLPQQRSQFIASRWAVKEAAVKASGIRLYFPDIRVLRAPGSQDPRPVLEVFGQSKLQLTERHMLTSHVSLSHDGDYTTAVVVFEGPD